MERCAVWVWRGVGAGNVAVVRAVGGCRCSSHVSQPSVIPVTS